MLTIGSFDGVHLGHQKLLKRIRRVADRIDGESILITFHPHPRTVVRSEVGIQLLSDLEEKIELIEAQELDHLVVVPFTRSFSAQSPTEYVENFLYCTFQPHTIVIGYNHRFGKNRAGDMSFLRSKAVELGFEVEQISKQEVEDLSVSSTKIRKALTAGEIATATALLGRPYRLSGIVERGQQVGRTLGFPTANLALAGRDKLVPREGVYAVQVMRDGQTYNGMLNIGHRPTLNGFHRSIEVHLFDFSGNIYGEKISVDLLQFLREEEKFDGLDSLKAQIERDRISTLDFLRTIGKI